MLMPGDRTFCMEEYAEEGVNDEQQYDEQQYGE